MGYKEVAVIDYFPEIYYKSSLKNNSYYVKIRLDGSPVSERFRNIGQSLADKLVTVCTEVIEERGYITYVFEINEQEQLQIFSKENLSCVSETEIALSRDITWDWKQTPHLLLQGNTGSGKTILIQYIISCLLEQGVRVVYCDPKNDDSMRLFAEHNPITYTHSTYDIVSVIKDICNELRSREMDLKTIGIEEAEFNPLYVFFDEMIAFKLLANHKDFEEVSNILASIAVSGRSKRIYVGYILQRGDVEFMKSGAIRDNLNCRISLGWQSEMAYQILFGSDFSKIKNLRKEIGSGLIFRQGIDSRPREFVAPFINKGALISKR